MSTIASPLSIAGTRQSGQPVRTQNGKLLSNEKTDAANTIKKLRKGAAGMVVKLFLLLINTWC